MSNSGTKHGVYVAASALLLVACQETQAPGARGTQPLFSVESCWPPSESCQERALEEAELQRVQDQINRMRTTGNCGAVKGQAQADLDAGNIRMQTSAPYAEGQTGDRHNSVGITHLVKDAFYSEADGDLQMTLIHETTHALGGDDPAAYGNESTCLGPTGT